MISPYFLNTGTFILIYAILALGLNLSMGFTGMLNLGHIAFWSVGAYTSAIMVKAGFPWLLAFFCSGLAGALCAYVLTALTRKLTGDYFALSTLGFTFIVHSILINNLIPATGGPIGIAGIFKPTIFGVKIGSGLPYFLLTLFVFGVVLLFLYRLTRSRYGKLYQAVRDDRIGVQSLGKNVGRLQYQSMMVAGFLAGIAGSLFAHYIGFIDPSTFLLSELVIVFTIVMVGGLASLSGTVLSAIIVLSLFESLRFLDIPAGVVGPLRMMVYALFLIAVLLFRPKGLRGKVDLH